MKNNRNGYPDLENLDPAVASVLQQGSRRQREMHMRRSDRKKTIREREKAAARRGRRALYDLPEELILRVKKLAGEYRTSASQIAGLGLYMLLERVKTGEIDLNNHLVPIDNPRYENLLNWELEDE